MAAPTNILHKDISLQVSMWDNITDLDTTDFEITTTNGTVRDFLIKNEGTESVTLSVLPASAKADGSYVSTVFEPGWNAEICRKIESEGVAVADLKWGY